MRLELYMSACKSPIVGRKVRFALVGCGRIANNHFEAISRHGDRAELVDVCDTDCAALDVAVARTGVRGSGSLKKMLAQSDADCVVLTTPSGLHPAQAALLGRRAARIADRAD